MASTQKMIAIVFTIVTGVTFIDISFSLDQLFVCVHQQSISVNRKEDNDQESIQLPNNFRPRGKEVCI